MNNSQKNEYWPKLFEKYDILDIIKEHGVFEISSKQINEFKEARLMTKFDFRSQLPKLFKDNNLSILPITRGNYLIGKFDAFCSFENSDVETISIHSPTFLQSIDFNDITSEATAINCIFVSKILQKFTAEDELYPTVNGRMSSNSFEFSINTPSEAVTISVANSQIEIDGGFESPRSLILIEAKNDISDDFLVRQIYYPYRLWTEKIAKPVRNVFLSYSNGIFHLREYHFKDKLNYNSLVLVKEQKYKFFTSIFNTEVLESIIDSVKIIDEPNIPFPQANSFDRVINLCELIKQNFTINKDEITSTYDFDERQTDYYINACRYLGIIQKSSDYDNLRNFTFTDLGSYLFKLSLPERQIEFVKLILSHSVFNKVLKLYLQKGELPTKDEVVDLMKQSNLYKIDSEKTFFRRSSTIFAWTNWIINQLEV